MTITTGHLDSLLGLSLDPQALASLDYLSGSVANNVPAAVSARTGNAPYAAAISLAVTKVNDASNTIVVTATINVADPYGYGNGGSSTVPYSFTVIGQSGADLLLAANGAAATQSLSAATVASAIQSGSAATLSNDLFAMAIDGTMLGTGVVVPQTLNFAALANPVETVAAALAGTPSGTTQIVDSASQVAANLDPLQTLLTQGKLSSLALTDSGFANLAITPAQLSGDQGLLNLMSGNFTLTEDASAANLTMTGLAGHANIAAFTGKASQYSVASAGDGVTFTVTDNGTGRVSTDHLGNFTALKFSDFTDFVAQTPSSTSVTTGNITELYGAVFGRLPDAAGLAFYQAELKTVPGLSLFALAQNFLASPEYVNNPSHSYAQNASGDAQFITDSYNSLLHRGPESGAVPFYQAIITQYTQGLTPGSAAYANAALQGHALVLVDMSASAEFLTNVQITAAHPADATHWLYLI